MAWPARLTVPDSPRISIVGVGEATCRAVSKNRHHRRHGNPYPPEACPPGLQAARRGPQLPGLEAASLAHAQLLGAAGLDQIIRRTCLDRIPRGIDANARVTITTAIQGACTRHLRQTQFPGRLFFAQAQIEKASGRRHAC